MDVARGQPVETEPAGRRARAASALGVEALGPRSLAVAAVWAAGAGCLAAAGLLQGRLEAVGRPDLAVALPVLAVYTVGFAVSAAVGGALLIRHRGGAVGGLFLALALSQVGGLALDLYARYGALARPGAVPAAGLVAHLVDPVFLVFFATMGVALHLIPTGRTLGRRWAWAARATVAAATAAYVGGVVSDRAIDPPFGAVANPLAVPALSAGADVARAVGAMGTAVGLVVGGASVIVRYRRSAAPDRDQLRWLVAAVVPLPVYLVLAFAWRRANNDTPLLMATAGWTVVIPAATWWCISRRRLFDMDGVLSAGVAYLLSTAVVIATYAVTVAVAGDAVSGITGSATMAPVVATLAAVSVMAPARRRIQDTVDRRFNRRRFDALRLVEAHLADPAGIRPPVEDVLRSATGDPGLTVTYRIEAEGDRRWVASNGREAAAPTDPAGTVLVRRDGAPIARVGFDPARADRRLVEAVAARARPELDNARLRAALTLQLVEVADSRARIAAAQLAERQRIERNLHDGAQQRLLALGLELRSAQLNGGPDRLAAAVDVGIDLARTALVELRDLAHGLCPPVLADGGLAAALDDLAAHAPIPLQVTSTDTRFAPAVEQTAWFVVSEAVANAAKHAQASAVTITARTVPAATGTTATGTAAAGGPGGHLDGDGDGEATDRLAVTVADDGRGGADPDGRGLQGLRDRAEAVGGTLTVVSPPGGGTEVRLLLPAKERPPCGS